MDLFNSIFCFLFYALFLNLRMRSVYYIYIFIIRLSKAKFAFIPEHHFSLNGLFPSLCCCVCVCCFLLVLIHCLFSFSLFVSLFNATIYTLLISEFYLLSLRLIYFQSSNFSPKKMYFFHYCSIISYFILSFSLHIAS